MDPLDALILVILIFIVWSMHLGTEKAKSLLCYEPYEGIDIKEIYMHDDNYRYVIDKSLIMSFMIHVADWYLQMTSVIQKRQYFLPWIFCFIFVSSFIWLAVFLIDVFIMTRSTIISFWRAIRLKIIITIQTFTTSFSTQLMKCVLINVWDFNRKCLICYA